MNDSHEINDGYCNRKSIVYLYNDPVDKVKYVFNRSIVFDEVAVGRKRYEVIKAICALINIDNSIFDCRTTTLDDVIILGVYPQYPNYNNSDMGVLTDLKKQFAEKYDAIWRCDNKHYQEREEEIGNRLSGDILNQFKNNFDDKLGFLMLKVVEYKSSMVKDSLESHYKGYYKMKDRCKYWKNHCDYWCKMTKSYAYQINQKDKQIKNLNDRLNDIICRAKKRVYELLDKIEMLNNKIYDIEESNRNDKYIIV